MLQLEVRRRGLPDPLSHIEEVNCDLLESLGVNHVEIEANVLGGYRYWVNTLERSCPEAALGALNGIWELYTPGKCRTTRGG